MVHFYSWRKDQPLHKTPIQERSGPIAASSDANYVAMGSHGGSVYIWEASTGALLRVFEAHYSKITAVTFTKDDSFLLTGGDDGVINCWSLESILDREQTVLRVKQSFSDHALGITAIHCGYGGFNSRFYSVSLDRTCRVWDLVQGKSIASIVYPTYLTTVTVDAAETSVYVGGGDGIIYQTDLVNLNQSVSPLESGGNGNNQQSFVSQTSSEMSSQMKKIFIGHTKPLTTLALSMDGSLLVSGATDGSVNIWDTYSRQIVRSLTNIKGSISSIIVTMKPIDLLNINMSGDNRKNYDPLHPFEKFISPVDAKQPLQAKLKSIQQPNSYSTQQLQQSYNPFQSHLNLSLNQQSSSSSSSSSKVVNNNVNSNNNSSNNSNEEISKLKSEIEELKKVNKNLLDRIVTQTVKEGDVMPSVSTVKQQLNKMKEVTEKANKNMTKATAKAAAKVSKVIAPIVDTPTKVKAAPATSVTTTTTEQPTSTNNNKSKKRNQQKKEQPQQTSTTTTSTTTTTATNPKPAASKLKESKNNTATTTTTTQTTPKVPKKSNPIKDTVISSNTTSTPVVANNSSTTNNKGYTKTTKLKSLR
ncbi:WD40 repeat-containing protein [Heterostelium album PN500]|uniref:WD40 repeat-containing protein n=1 Tax=Heterostelium pallidum (strain ATCC 26659 / Pp 5 / PN500) TaxID=670386 RepID=D3BSJ3_HETP5|nr:WD40 repeat-containing protein [Heterostelium album PN500]EFA75458.1 WD40 repeat-containing protein [Heterostelium album PN500]|eukprot:XP_020427592.1 WD40 repeat-containing protein [Heterostelium album PN500]